MLRCLFIGLAVLQCARGWAQEGRGDVRFVWWNTENFFDPFDDSLTEDEEFLPWSPRHWTWERFERKTVNISRVIAATGGWKPPEIIGLAEIENKLVMHRLCRKSPLLKYNYQWIHEDSPDSRGIDVALMYLPSSFQPLHYAYHKAYEEKGIKTRDILYVKGLVAGGDTLHLILNHWPSRWGGILETEGRRAYAAACCRRLIDSIMHAGGRPCILIAGDFNDEATDNSIKKVLAIQSCREPDGPYPDSLIFKLERAQESHVEGSLNYDVEGSLKYQGRWYGFDQVFVSGHMLYSGNQLSIVSGKKQLSTIYGGKQLNSMHGQDARSGLFVMSDGLRIYQPAFLLERDDQYTGMKPRRTWIGYRYQDGFSDHLPVIVDLYTRDIKSRAVNGRK